MRSVPVVVIVTPPEAAVEFRDLLDDYGAVLVAEDRVEIEPIDDVRRGTVIYRVIQASRTLTAGFADAELHLVTEDGNRWRLPPPAL